MLLAWGGLRLLVATNAGSIPRSGEIDIDWRVLLFTLGLAVATGMVFGLAPILHMQPSALLDMLKSAAGRATSSAAANRFRAVLVSSELALALVLLIGSGLMVKAFWKLQEVNSRLQSGPLAHHASSPCRPRATPPDAGRWLLGALLARVNALPGVSSASIGDGPAAHSPNQRQRHPDRNLPSRSRTASAKHRLLELRRRPAISGRWARA